ncbi:hypothetical protein HDC94_000928 [Leifsonia sp. AK011]|uniref:Cap15 family cyclic dinucleotide receptor domain-containing protein n=1 Tax=Leifsonia sp. AK011 TaxID=2723075 RepID=UPI0015C9036D|nr:hypothetical protein [Leifsonia sp. AK011]NYF09772.1 hypothetical protein [Leifsonia sp. AK011]
MLSTLASISVLIAIVTSALLQKIEFEYDWLVSAPTVAASFALLYKFVDIVAWRCQWLRALGLIDIPVVDGTYVGLLHSKHTGEAIRARVRIEQTWSRMQVRLDLPEAATSSSTSVAASLTPIGHNDVQLVYTYKNQIMPASADDDMRDHDGTADVVIEPGGRLTGRYFNARGRQGELRLEREAAK